MKTVTILFAFLAALPLTVPGGDLVTGRDLAAMDAALHELEMSRTDFGFDKDAAEPDWFFQWSKDWLHDPLQMTGAASRLLDSVEHNDQPPWTCIRDALEVSSVDRPPMIRDRPSAFGDLGSLLDPMMDACQQVAELIEEAFSELTPADRHELTLDLFAGTFMVEHYPEAHAGMLEDGFSEEEITRWIMQGSELDPEPYARHVLTLADTVQLAPLVEAAELLHASVRRLAEAASEQAAWPETARSFDTPLGPVWVGTVGADTWNESALLILDPAGDDVYDAPAGAARGTKDRPVAVLIDLKGSDRYISHGLTAPGSAVFGAACLLDLEGTDVYHADWTGTAAGLYGVAMVEDRGGDDTYRAQALGQGAGHAGLGVLEDRSGRDLYDVGFAGQGYAGIFGYGLLLDREGNDVYQAGGVRPDYERHDDRYLSLAQGFSIGSRPRAGGGQGVLIDLQGDDRYTADIYGQGVGYWYSAGMLLDVEGNDQYQMFQYGQGAGIHLSLGLLADLAGRDQYTGYVLTQGAAHDYAVGIMIDGAGDDTYTADHYSQGRAMNNSLAILLDRDGQDGYFSRQCDRSQGIGNDGDLREYGSLALLLDRGGKDIYSCGGEDNQSVQRPFYGIIHDREDSDE